MDVTALAVDINNLKLSNDVGISVLKKAMDVTKQQSSELLDEIKELELLYFQNKVLWIIRYQKNHMLA